MPVLTASPNVSSPAITRAASAGVDVLEVHVRHPVGVGAR